MRLLVVVSMYPHPGHPYSGVFNRNCVEAAASLGHECVVLAPRPWVPPFLKMHPRWEAYAKIPAFDRHGDVEVHRPGLVQVPRLATTFQRNRGAFLQIRHVARRLHKERIFDAVFSFDLGGAGGLAWRLGQDLEIPATGWAFGLDVRVPKESPDAEELRRMLNRLDLVFYQSSELRDIAESLLKQGQTLDKASHVVLPHGIPSMEAAETRATVREELGIPEQATLLLFLSRIVKGKGVDELLEAFGIAAKEHPDLHLVMVGETPGFDDSPELRATMERMGLGERIRMLPACDPAEVRDYHAAADIFAFPSKSEGMPNALLEAMALGTPAIAFDIPPIRDILRHGDCLCAVGSFDAAEFGEKLGRLVESSDRRTELVANGKRVVAEHFDITRNVRRALELTAELQRDASRGVST